MPKGEGDVEEEGDEIWFECACSGDRRLTKVWLSHAFSRISQGEKISMLVCGV